MTRPTLAPPFRTLVPLLLGLLVTGCGGDRADDAAGTSADRDPTEEAGRSSLDFGAMADLLLERADLQPGKRVLLVGVPGRFSPLASRLRAGVRGAGAEDLGAWTVNGDPPAAWGTEFTRRLEGREGAELVEVLSDVDLGVMLPGADATHPVYAGLQEVLRSGRGRTIHFHWAGAFGMDDRELPVTSEVDALYQRALLETDYDALAREQEAFERAVRDTTVRVTTPAGTDLSFRIGDRPVNRQDGDASADRARHARTLIDREVELPAGAVRVAPLEETVRGTIAFPPNVWAGETVEGLVMTFEEGRVVDVAADRNVEVVRSVMEQVGDPARSFREFALGFNRLMPVQRDGAKPWIPYYGYGAGIVRLSLGDNTELSGDVGGGWVRWNFFTDATVTVDDETWVEEGRLTLP